MRRYTVYRVYSTTGKKEAVGCIVDRRRTGREMRQNFLALLVETRELFREASDGRSDIVLESPGPAAGSEERTVAQELAAVGATG